VGEENEAKEDIVSNNFQAVMGLALPRTHDFTSEEIKFENPDLEILGEPFSDDEVRDAINQMPNDKASDRMVSYVFSLRDVWKQSKWMR
jgi:hypothetical protein